MSKRSSQPSASKPKRVETPSNRLVIFITNGDADVQAIQVDYRNMPDELAAAVRERIYDRLAGPLFEGVHRNVTNRKLLIAIGVVKPDDPAEWPIEADGDWNDGDDFPAFSQLHATVPCFMHNGWMARGDRSPAPSGFVGCDVLMLRGFL